MSDHLTMRSGQLRHRLVLEQPVFTSDGGGGTTRSWQVTATLWAAVTPMSLAGAADAEQPGGRIGYRVICRYRSDLRPGQRFRDGQQHLDIYAVVDPDGRRRWVECRCREHQS